jgi:hypothetical protein
MRARSVLLCAAVAGASTLVAAPAAAAEPVGSCGAVLSADAYLAADLVCPEGDGVTLLDGVELDLRGHRLVGGGSGTGVRYRGDATVRDGTVTGWGSGMEVEVTGVPREEDPIVQVHRMRFTDNDAGVVSAAGPSTRPDRVDVVASRFERNGTALFANFGSHIDVRASVFVENDRATAVITAGIAVTGSRFDRNGVAVDCDESGCVLDHNVLRDNDRGVAVRTFGAELTGNVISGGGVGFDAFAAFAGSTLTDNVFRGVGTAVSLWSSSATLTDNLFVGNDVGFTGEGDAPLFSAALEGNRFVRNGDGILGVGVPTTLRDNSALANERWGIHAPGATDLGGNTARANGTEPQCVGVAC